jgi:hypothetical protein
MHIARNVALLGPNRMTARDHNPRLTAMIVKSYVVQALGETGSDF